MFRMGSGKRYPEKLPVHRVTVDSFWVDRTPVINRQFKQFVRYPGALPHMLYAGSLVFTPPRHPVDLRNFGEWWRYPSLRKASTQMPAGPVRHPCQYLLKSEVRLGRPHFSRNEKTIADGVPKPRDYEVSMPPKGGAPLPDSDVAAVSAYVWSISHAASK
jgi:hypothetical protein